VMYEQRVELMETDDVSDTIDDMCADITADIINAHMPLRSYAEQWDMEGLHKELYRIFGLDLPVSAWVKEDGVGNEEVLVRVRSAVDTLFQQKEEAFGADIMTIARKRLLMETLDQLWKDHLLSLDHLRAGIGLRAYGQRDPLNEYKQEAFGLFERMLGHLREVIIQRLAHLHISVNRPPEAIEAVRPLPSRMRESRVDPAMAMLDEEEDAHLSVGHRTNPEDRDPADPSTWGRVGRNEPCPCGSGRKFKQCHGIITG
jgi:preprotein translocase subunit SecA